MKSNGFLVWGIGLILVISVIILNSNIGASVDEGSYVVSGSNLKLVEPDHSSKEGVREPESYSSGVFGDDGTVGCIGPRDCFINALAKANDAILPVASNANEADLKAWLLLCAKVNGLPNPVFGVNRKDIPKLISCKKTIALLVYNFKENIIWITDPTVLTRFLANGFCPIPLHEEYFFSFRRPNGTRHTMYCSPQCNADGSIELYCQNGDSQGGSMQTLTITGPNNDSFNTEWHVASSDGSVVTGSTVTGVGIVSQA